MLSAKSPRNPGDYIVICDSCTLTNLLVEVRPGFLAEVLTDVRINW